MSVRTSQERFEERKKYKRAKAYHGYIMHFTTDYHIGSICGCHIRSSGSTNNLEAVTCGNCIKLIEKKLHKAKMLREGIW